MIRWLSTSKELPEEREIVLAWGSVPGCDTDVYLARIIGRRWVERESSCDMEDVTHWARIDSPEVDEYTISIPKLGPGKLDWADTHLEAIMERIRARYHRLVNSLGGDMIQQIEYDLVGKPYGDDEAGLARYLVEQAIKQEIEEIRERYGRNPNDLDLN